MISNLETQRKVCEEWGSEFVETLSSQKIGISENTRDNIFPINGLRHPPSGDTSGWYIWAGNEIGSSDDFFLPLHAEHLDEWCPIIEKYLGLAPGWRFLIAPDYEDVWFDASLLADE